MMNELVAPSAVAQRVTVKFTTNENVKPAGNLMRLRAQFNDETPPRIQMYDWNKSFNDGRTEENKRRLHFLQGKLWPAFYRTLTATYSPIF